MHDPNQLYSQPMMGHPPPSQGFVDPSNPAGGMPYVASAGMIPNGAMSSPMATAMPAPMMPPIGAVPPDMTMMDPIPKTKGRKKNIDPTTALAEQMAMENMSPEMVTQMQVEQAIKESQNPGMKLRKLRSPLNVRSCLLNVLAFVVLTLVIVFLIIAFWPGVGVDQFHFPTVIGDMWVQFGFAGFFSMIGNWFTGLFSGCGAGGDAYEVISWIIR